LPSLLNSCIKIGYRTFRTLLTIFLGKRGMEEYFKKYDPVTKVGNIITRVVIRNRPHKANGIKAIPRRNTDDYFLLFVDREKEIKEHLKFVKGDVFVDVGANVGYYTLKAATDYGNDITVIAIEAHPETFKALCRNIACNNFSNIIAINKAVSNKKDILSLYESIDKNGSVISGRSSIFFDHTRNRSYEVPCDTLDDILVENDVHKPSVLKMDIEGAEVVALSGATKTLKELRKIIVEVHGTNLEKVTQIIQGHGFDTKIVSTTGESYVVGTRAN